MSPELAAVYPGGRASRTSLTPLPPVWTRCQAENPAGPAVAATPIPQRKAQYSFHRKESAEP